MLSLFIEQVVAYLFCCCQGEERISLIGTFQRDGRDLPTCQTKRRVSLIRDKVVTVLFNPKTVR